MKHFIECLQARAAATPDRTVFTFLEGGERESARLTFSELDAQARAIAAELRTVASIGDRALLVYPPNQNFVCGLLGCLYAGIIAVPAYPPRKNRSASRIDSIIKSCEPALALTDSETLGVLESTAGSLKLIATDRVTGASPLRTPDLAPQSIALLQYTSGSTATPKGVMISHANIFSNLQVLTVAGGLDDSSISVGWLPLFHDMGLFGKVLLPIYLGSHSVLMDPAAFVQKPVRWLQAITKYRGNLAAAPDSAYDLCVRRVSDEAKASLDLSCWRIAYNGAEPVRARTLERFSRAFAACGFRETTLRPVYGMAETTLYASGQPAQTPPLVKSFDADALSRNIASPAADANSQSLVSCGRAWLDHEIRIADPETGEPCGAGQIGEIWISGSSVATGYWNQAEESARTFNAHLPNDTTNYLRSGDLGFIDGEDLFVTGRLKDLIIVAGRNHYPQDLEGTAESSHPSLMPNASAAFSVEVQHEERVVLVCEVRREALRQLDINAIAKSIRQALSAEHELELHALVLLRPSTALRTSSGKIQRRRIRQAYIDGSGLEVAAAWRNAKDIARWLRERVAALAGIPSQQLDTREPFHAYGLGSQEAISLSGELEEWLGRPLPPTLVYDFPNILELARHLSGEERTTEHQERPEKREAQDIAIIGMSCRFPGAPNPEAFWRLLREGRDAISPAGTRVAGLPPTGLLERVDEFDADFFGINAREAESMDPQQRLLLEVAWETLESAGLSPQSLAGSNTAVIVGISNTDYIRLAQSEAADVGPYVATGNALSIAANRISYTFDFRGPSWAVDTACSSSLVAVHQACASLNRGECDAALAGGANLILAPQLSASFTQAGMLSPDGRCKTFDAAANGYVRGEGVGLILLKRLEDAIQNRDPILAVIRGSALNQDGRSNGLTAPNGPAQQTAIRTALRAAGVQPREIGFVETHGTGTPLGDPIELNSLVAVLNEGRSQDEPCFVGSVKTNVGHLESAAGIAGLIKTVLMLKHREIPPHIHYRSLNPAIALADAPFRIVESVTPWTTTLFAGVSSFGFGGTNAHIVLSAPPAPAPDSSESQPCPVVISARTSKALKSLVTAYCQYIDQHPDIRLCDLAFTANTGRARFAHQISVMASSLSELRTKLLAQETEEIVDEAVPGNPRRLALPTYPFERRRYWLESSHPLLGRRLDRQAPLADTWTWEQRIEGPAADWLKGHRVMGATVLPYSVYIEMALSAAMQAGVASCSKVEDLTLHAPLMLREGESPTVQTVLSRENGGHLSFAVYHRTPAAKWRICASARIH